MCVSCFTLVAISLERYFAICRPLHSRKWQTLSHSYKTIIVCWALGFLVCIPIAVFTKYRKRPYGNAICQEVWGDHVGHKTYTILLDIILLVLPVIVMSISYGNIARTLWIGMRMEKHEMGKISLINTLCTDGSVVFSHCLVLLCVFIFGRFFVV